MNNSVQILLVDDDEVDVEAIQRTFYQEDVDIPIITAMNGKQALEILQGEDRTASLSAPYLVLLDINMPVMNGLEFMREVRSDPVLSHTLIFVLSNCDNPDLVADAYEKHISGFIHKEKLRSQPRELANLLGQFQKLNEFPHY